MRKTQLFKVVSLMALPMLLLISCSKDEPYNEIENYGKYKESYNALFNTSWKVEEWGIWNYQDGKWIASPYNELQSNIDRFGGDDMIITFTNKEVDGGFEVICNLWPDAETRIWYIQPPGFFDWDEEYMKYPNLITNYNGHINGEYESVNMPYGPITEFTPNRITIEYTHVNNTCHHRAVLTRVANPSQDNNSQSK